MLVCYLSDHFAPFLTLSSTGKLGRLAMASETIVLKLKQQATLLDVSHRCIAEAVCGIASSEIFIREWYNDE